MGQTKIQLIGSEEKPKEKKKEKKPRVVAVSGEIPQVEEKKATDYADSEKSTRTKKKKSRGKKYLASLAKIEPNKLYTFSDAAKLVKKTSIESFDGSVRLSLIFAKKSNKGDKISVELPHSSGSKKKIEIASEATLEKIKEGKIDFDVLLASPNQMPKLVPFAKVLGPRGLMPNPKNGTLVADPEAEIAKFSANSVIVKLPKDSKSGSVVIGKTSQEESEIVANLEAVVKGVGARGLKKAVVSATMGPGIKVAIG